MKNFKNYFAVAKINFKRTTWIAYMIAGICMLAMLIDIIIDRSLQRTEDTAISFYCMAYIICILAPIFISSVNYTKLMNIGVKKKQYFFGCIINYIVFATIVSLFGVIETYLIDDFLSANGSTIYGLVRIFGWDSNVFTAFFSQFAFLLLVQSTIHTLTFMQTKWYGWVADAVIVVIISVFTPIPALRSVEEFFFSLIIFAKPLVQIFVCLALSALFYATNIYYLRKRI